MAIIHKDTDFPDKYFSRKAYKEWNRDVSYYYNRSQSCNATCGSGCGQSCHSSCTSSCSGSSKGRE